MQVRQRVQRDGIWSAGAQEDGAAQLVLVFSSTALLNDAATWNQLRHFYPNARIVACSTAGEILDTSVYDDSIACTAITFQHTTFSIAAVPLAANVDCTQLGEQLVAQLPRDNLVHVLVLSDGLKVNGSTLVQGMTANLPVHVAVTGGLSGDGPRFQRTAVCLDTPQPSEQVVAIGLYGDRLKVGYGSLGGWDPFGVERLVTKSIGNVLYELDGEPALDLYKRYLGEHASALPASGLLFPLAIRSSSDDQRPIVRTILAVDEAARSLTFAGDVPAGFRARLMRANFERLVDGAQGAAKSCLLPLGTSPAELAILISCVGRKLVLKQRVEDEVEAVRHTLGDTAALTGFYSYGEIAPFITETRCELHNQTMTITTLSER
jgi:hypothetical protein